MSVLGDESPPGIKEEEARIQAEKRESNLLGASRRGGNGERWKLFLPLDRVGRVVHFFEDL